MAGRYVCVELLGSGTYARVFLALDRKHQARAAVKVIRNHPAFHAAAKKEISLLRDLNGGAFTPKLLRHFDHDGHICLAFNWLGQDLAAVLGSR